MISHIKFERTTSTSISSDNYDSNDFSYQIREKYFNKHFFTWSILIPHHVDERYYRRFEFFGSFYQVNCKDFFYNKPKQVYLWLMKMFYTNINYREPVITPEVHKILISMMALNILLIYQMTWITSTFSLLLNPLFVIQWHVIRSLSKWYIWLWHAVSLSMWSPICLIRGSSTTY